MMKRKIDHEDTKLTKVSRRRKQESRFAPMRSREAPNLLFFVNPFVPFVPSWLNLYLC